MDTTPTYKDIAQKSRISKQLRLFSSDTLNKFGTSGANPTILGYPWREKPIRHKAGRQIAGRSNPEKGISQGTGGLLFLCFSHFFRFLSVFPGSIEAKQHL
jgi:hypothetical protein